MANWRDVFLAILTTFCLTSALFMTMPIQSQSDVGEYDPWTDLNGDGTIDIFDIARVAGEFGASGTPIEKASIEYDSGWIDIADKRGHYINIMHSLNSTEILVDITGKTTLDGGAHQMALGGANYSFPKMYCTYGGIGVDMAYSMAETDDGGYVLVGNTSSFGAGGYDVWLVKTDMFGNMVWDKTYGGWKSETAYSVVKTGDGGYALAGWTTSFGAGGYDVWLVKTDASGDMMWNKTYGGLDSDIGVWVIQTDDGGYAITGWTWSLGAGRADFWLIKTDSLGNEQWNETYGGVYDDTAVSLVQTDDGGYAMAGNRRSLGIYSDTDVWLVKTDALGNEQWNRTYGGASDEIMNSIIKTSDGGYAMAGYTASLGAGNSDVWLIKTDGTGDEQWNKTYGGLSDEWAQAMLQTGDGGYSMVGWTKSFGEGSADAWFVKTDALGNEQWNKTHGGTGYEVARSLVETSDGGYMIVGCTTSFGAGATDFWLIKTDASGNMSGIGGSFIFGLAWTDSTADTLTLYRGASDPYWNYVRVRIWKPKTP